jgi:superfamily I DNA/RNA helicase
MNKLSNEQQYILDRAKEGSNIIVDSVAGTGKTTIILSLAQQMPDKTITLITYNASLKFEVREKVEALELTNIKVHTYHSLAKGYYSSNAHEDRGLKDVVIKNLPPKYKLMDIDILVVDEVQDMTITYFKLLVKYLKDLGKAIQLIILGDYMQGLYDFKGADTRFLTLGEKIWEKHPNLRTCDFEKCKMKTSYRITQPICDFINNVMNTPKEN